MFSGTQSTIAPWDVKPSVDSAHVFWKIAVRTP